MKKSNTAQRLKEIMNEKNIKQVDILNACIPYCKKYGVKMSKSDISQYVSGKVEPGQDKLFVPGNALNVSEAWLMGFDVPKEKSFVFPEQNDVLAPEIMEYYEKLNILGQQTATEQVRLLTLDKKYTQKADEHFTNVKEAKEFLHTQPRIAAFRGKDIHALTDSDIITIANEIYKNKN